ncbi:hypothetical protein GCM10028857_25150 [Salinarchaeum chitinilyticum]
MAIAGGVAVGAVGGAGTGGGPGAHADAGTADLAGHDAHRTAITPEKGLRTSDVEAGSIELVDAETIDSASTTIGGSSTTTAGSSASPASSATGLSTSSSSASSASNASGASASAAQSGGSIVERVEYGLRPGQPDRVEATISYEIPDGVETLTFWIIHGEYEVVGLDGFEETEQGTFEWTGTGDGGTVTIRHDVTESFREGDVDGRYVDGTADWAIVTRPQTGTRWNYTGTNPGLEYELATDGEGYAGDRFAFLGPHELHQETVSGEQLSLVVPDAADPASTPTEILDSVAYASEQLHFGDTNRNDEVVLIAAPTDGADWSPPGLAIGSDARVSADAAVDDPVNVWVHEYVHTRQYRDADRADGDAVADNAHWLIEGSAEYYATLTSYEQGLIDFETFQSVLERGTEPPAADAVLADRSTWVTNDAEYEKGALVVGAIDRKLRAATDGQATFQDVMERWNKADTFTAADLEAAAVALGGESVGEFVETYTRTDATPSVWGKNTHEQLFAVEQPRFDYSVVSEPPLSVSSPYRQGELVDPLAVGENVTTRVRVDNVGNVEGTYRATITVGGQVLAEATGTLVPGETETVELAARLEATGDLRIVAGDYARTVTVVEPATPSVQRLRVKPESPVTGETVDVVATVSNPTSRPANGTVAIRADGEVIGTERVQLAPGANGTVAISTEFANAGEYEVTAGDLSVSVTVEEAGPLDLVPPVAVGAVVLLLFVGALSLAAIRRR